ncbi:MAG TPA: thioredoxin domain-containing protein [Longimicrobiales bacterium]|nr:thioredoxin domain-containing protein [Longimicrobiales bacterium]
MEAISDILAVTDQNFESVVEGSPGLAVVEFGADWCSICRAMAAVVEELARDLAGTALVATLDVDANPVTAARFGVRSLPTFLFFKDGTLAERMVGFVPRAALEATLAQLA